MYKTYLTILLCLLYCTSTIKANQEIRTLDDIQNTLKRSSEKCVQEKVYIHTDNTCYFVGDTLWYKAYVVRADDLKMSNISRILYVELLNPDGLVVERQNLVVSNKGGYSCGSFTLHDSLYSGYYELRAYTKWMLNFNEHEHRFGQEIKYSFYNYAMAHDFFRQWDGLYSRVLPIYKKPDEKGDFTYKRMYNRPKQRVVPAEKDKLIATFYPEGGHLIKGIENRIAFELTSQEGENINLTGSIIKDDKTIAKIKTTHNGKGVFAIIPDDERIQVKFHYLNKDYQFKLPKSENTGATVKIENGKAIFTTRQLPQDQQYGVSILCRGVLKYFTQVSFNQQGIYTLTLPNLPTGVNDITLFDNNGQILADRLFFVNNHDYDGYVAKVDSGMKITFDPYEAITLGIQCEQVDTVSTISVSVRDKQTDEPSYDDGNIMTDLLLSSELKGFIANPAYYFESDDEQHRQALDLLMMVQGWRKYKWEEQANPEKLNKRYMPEVTMTVEGAAYKLDPVYEVDPKEISYWRYGIGKIGEKNVTVDDSNDSGSGTETDMNSGEATETAEANNTYEIDDKIELPADIKEMDKEQYGSLREIRRRVKGSLKKEVYVEAELIVGKDIAGLAQKTTNGGRYLFQIPPFYGCGILNMKAYSVKDSLKKNMISGHEKGIMDETQIPDYFVKRDLFYPRFPNKYNYYQNHTPDNYVTPLDTMSELSMENDMHMLRNVNVKGKWHGKRAIDYSKPAFVCDAYEIYNELTDYGLSWGMFDARSFSFKVCQYLFGNMNRYREFNMEAKLNTETEKNYLLARNFTTGAPTWSMSVGKSDYYIAKQLQLKRFGDIQVYTDFEPRNEDADIEFTRTAADATVVINTIPNEAEQPTYRDRHIIIQGFDYPTEFYSPNYSQQHPKTPTDYRRTLYWNPNVKTDKNGRAIIHFYNNSRETRVNVSVAGITADGHFIRTK